MTTERPFDVPIYPLIEWIMQDKQRMIRFAEAVAAAMDHRRHDEQKVLPNNAANTPLPAKPAPQTSR